MKHSLLTTAVLSLAVNASAGTPLICRTFEIGDAPSLPWGKSWHQRVDRYDVTHLIADTLALLEPRTAVIVRMETLRRATLYASRDQRIGAELLQRVMARVKDREGDALTLFDAGYLAESYKQSHFDYANPARDVAGRTLVERALQIRGGDKDMELALSLIVMMKPRW